MRNTDKSLDGQGLSAGTRGGGQGLSEVKTDIEWDGNHNSRKWNFFKKCNFLGFLVFLAPQINFTKALGVIFYEESKCAFFHFMKSAGIPRKLHFLKKSHFLELWLPFHTMSVLTSDNLVRPVLTEDIPCPSRYCPLCIRMYKGRILDPKTP